MGIQSDACRNCIGIDFITMEKSEDRLFQNWNSAEFQYDGKIPQKFSRNGIEDSIRMEIFSKKFPELEFRKIPIRI